MVFGKLKNKKNLSGHCLLPFSHSEIRLLFFIDGIAIRFHVFSYIIHVWLDDLCLFCAQWKNFLKVMFKFCLSIILNFWNRVLKIENLIFASVEIGVVRSAIWQSSGWPPRLLSSAFLANFTSFSASMCGILGSFLLGCNFTEDNRLKKGLMHHMWKQ